MPVLVHSLQDPFKLAQIYIASNFCLWHMQQFANLAWNGNRRKPSQVGKFQSKNLVLHSFVFNRCAHWACRASFEVHKLWTFSNAAHTLPGACPPCQVSQRFSTHSCAKQKSTQEECLSGTYSYLLIKKIKCTVVSSGIKLEKKQRETFFHLCT